MSGDGLSAAIQADLEARYLDAMRRLAAARTPDESYRVHRYEVTPLALRLGYLVCQRLDDQWRAEVRRDEERRERRVPGYRP